jgi:predicted DNA-binding transcriptional regulator YafY
MKTRDLVESLTGSAGDYRPRSGTAMPPLLLDDDEAGAIAVGHATADRASVNEIKETAVRALVKLEQDAKWRTATIGASLDCVKRSRKGCLQCQLSR